MSGTKAKTDSKPAAPKDGKPGTKRDERRAELLAAAREIFGEKGFHEATVDDITRRAGVAKGTFYLYFPEKKEVYYELVSAFFQQIITMAGSIAPGVNDVAEFFSRMQLAGVRLFQIFHENHVLARLAYRESASLDPNVEKMLRDFYRKLAEVEAENVRLGMRLGVFRKVDPMICAYAHIGMFERVALVYSREPNAHPPAEVLREMLALAYEGLRPAPRDAKKPATAAEEAKTKKTK
jgi:AcrR family transcriptional regulator